MKQTTFARWLETRGEKPYAYARRKNISPVRVQQLAGFGHQTGKPPGPFKYELLAAIRDDSGIPPEMLVKEAIEAAADPVPPRRYIKKEEGDGKAAAE